MLGEKYTLDIRPTFIDELDRAVTYIEQDYVMEVRWFRYSKSTRDLSANPAYDTANPYMVE